MSNLNSNYKRQTMFEPKTFQEKRAAMTEILLQQVLNEVLRITPVENRERLMQAFGNYARGMQSLRDREAERVLGPVIHEEGQRVADLTVIRDYLEANLGRTYFDFVNHTKAADGAIGTAGFKKFNDWVKELPELDVAMSREIQTGFYRDSSTVFGRNIPILLIRKGPEVTVIIFNQHYAANTLHLDYVAKDYRWDAANHYPLRGEMYTYRNSLTVEQFEAAFAEALAQHTDTPLARPEVPEVVETTDFVQVEEAAAEEAAEFKRGETPVVAHLDEGPYITQEEVPAFDGQSR